MSRSNVNNRQVTTLVQSLNFPSFRTSCSWLRDNQPCIIPKLTSLFVYSVIGRHRQNFCPFVRLMIVRIGDHWSDSSHFVHIVRCVCSCICILGKQAKQIVRNSLQILREGLAVWCTARLYVRPVLTMAQGILYLLTRTCWALRTSLKGVRVGGLVHSVMATVKAEPVLTVLSLSRKKWRRNPKK